MGRPKGKGFQLELLNRSGARNGLGIEAGASSDEEGGWSRDVELSFSFRPGARWEMSLDPEWERREDSRQFVMAVPNGRPETFGTR